MKQGIESSSGDGDHERLLMEKLVELGFGIGSAVTRHEMGFSPTLKGMHLLGMIADINRELPGLTPKQVVTLFQIGGYQFPQNLNQ